MYKSVVKRVLDFLLALAGTIVLSPLLLVLAAWVKLDSKGPVFFRQKRVGRDKRLLAFLNFVPCMPIRLMMCPRICCRTRRR